MKKYTMLFLVLSGLIVLMFGAVPQLHVSAQCISGFACATPVPPASNQGDKKHKDSIAPTATLVPTPVPTSTATMTSSGPILAGPSSNLPTAFGGSGGGSACTGGWLLCTPGVFPWGVGGLLLLLLGGGFVLFRSRFMGLPNPATQAPIDPCWVPSDSKTPIDPCWVPSPEAQAPIDPCWVTPDSKAPIDPCWVPSPEAQTPIDPCWVPSDSNAPINPCWTPGSISQTGPELPG